MLVALYKTKGELKSHIGQPLQYQETSLFGSEYKADGDLVVVGPSAYNRRWYAGITMKNGRIESVR